MPIKRVHLAVFPNTDHGRTEVEWMWFEENEVRVSPIIPCSGYCERLGHMPGGPVICDIGAETEVYAPFGVSGTERTEEVHNDGFYEVGPVCIRKVTGP